MAISLSSLRKTGVARPLRIVVYGTHGIGKSTFASQAPNPVYIVTEEAGAWSCTCPAAKWQKGDCKHIKQIQSQTVS